MSGETIKFEIKVNATPAQAYKVFTNATSLREWCCDIATVDPKPEGRIYLAWNRGYYTAGEYKKLEDDKTVAFTWQGRGEPSATLVEVNIAENGDGSIINLTHSGLGTGPEWDNAKQEFTKGWKNSLENLVSIFETGEDLRFVMRPMLGITINDFNENIAKQIGVPVKKGIRIDDTLEEMGARAAGLQSDDVIIEFNNQKIEDFSNLNNALIGLKAGDTTEVTFYRGNVQKTVTMELSKRPIPEIPQSPLELSKKLSAIYLEVEDQLNQFLDDITEEEAAFKPDSDEWSVNEILAHLIQGERFYHFYVTEIVGGQERWSDGYGGNVPGFIEATVESYGTLANLRAELKRTREETVLLFAKLPVEFLENKASYWRLAYGALEGTFHDTAHLEQMKSTVNLARSR